MPGALGQRDRAQGARGASQRLAPPATAMTENSDKVPIALVGPDDVEFCSPPVSTAPNPRSRCRVSGHAGPGLCAGAWIDCPESGICATECGRWVPKYVRVQGARDPQTSGKGSVGRDPGAGVLWPEEGAEPRGDGPAPPKVCLSYIHAKFKGPSGGSAAKGGAPSPTPAPSPRRRGADVTRPPPTPGPGPQAYATVTVKPSSPARLLKLGAVVLISGAVLLLFGTIGAFYFWKGSDNHVSPEGVAQECGHQGECGCAGRGGARGREARGAAGSSLSPACSPLGGARAQGRSRRLAPARAFLWVPSGHLLPSSLPHGRAALCSWLLCRKASQGFNREY